MVSLVFLQHPYSSFIFRCKSIESIQHSRIQISTRGKWIKGFGQICFEKKPSIYDNERILAIILYHSNNYCILISQWTHSFYNNNHAGFDVSTLSLYTLSKQSWWNPKDSLYEIHRLLEYACNDSIPDQFLHLTYMGNFAI